MPLTLILFLTMTIVGTLVAIVWQNERLHHERKLFGQAIDRQALSLWAYLIGGLIGGVALSLMATALALVIPTAVLVWLTGLTVVALLLSGVGYSPWWLAVAGPLAALVALPGVRTAGNVAGWAWRVLVLVAAAWALQAVLLRLIDPPIAVPTIHAGKRGAAVATYAHRQFYWVPLVLPLPGSWFHALPWWPLLGTGSGRFSLLVFPLILGVALHTRKGVPSQAATRWGRQYLWASGCLLILAALAAWQLQWSLALLCGGAIIGLGLGLSNAWASRQGPNYISQTSTGVRLVAIQPDTPAAKMGLSAGDIVLTCNDQPVTTAIALYEAIQAHPTYCRLKIQRLDGQLQLVETAIYKGAPHELGMVTFAEDVE